MTKEYTGPEFRPIFNAAMAAWWAGNCEGADPADSWECKTPGEMWNKYTDRKPPQYVSGKIYRFKPAPKRTVTIGYLDSNGDWQQKELVAPETVAPATGTFVFTADDKFFWSDKAENLTKLINGLVFLSDEDAQAMSDWTAKCRGGGV